MMRISLTNFKLFIVFLLVSVFFGKIIIAQDNHRACILVAEDKDYFTFVEPPLYFRSTPRENLVRTSTINVTYNGFSTEAQTAFQYAVDIIETEITSSITIELIANWVSLGGSVLGSAGATFITRNFSSAPLSNTWYQIALANKLAGSDLLGSEDDIVANFNSDFSNWYFGTDGDTPTGKYDFVSVVLHEIIHGLGFAGSMTVTGAIGRWGSSSSPYVYDVNAVNGSNEQLINTSIFGNPSTALGTELTSNNIFFDGTNAVIGNGGTNPKLYTPASWNPSSSYSHWDETTYPAGNINSLMTYAIGSAESIHHPGYITRGLLKDIGWTIDQPLPVELSSFTAKVLRNGGVQLDWTTETEIDNFGFEVERASSSTTPGFDKWEKIGFVEGHGNSNSPKNYSFVDSNPVGSNIFFYRLKQIDNDGKFVYTDKVEVRIILVEFTLSQNYPNPFNPTTNISYSLANSEMVSVKVYDIIGKEVADLVNQHQRAGNYNISFDACNLPSGIFFYTIKAGPFVETRKMTLIK